MTEQYEFKCNHCGHPAHCDHSCTAWVTGGAIDNKDRTQ